MRRAILGILGLVLFVGGGALYLANPEVSGSTLTSGMMVRIGGVLLLLWLAYHQVVRLFEVVPPWMIAAVVVGIGVVIAFPKFWLAVVCLFGILLVLHLAGFVLKPLAAKGQAKRKADKPRQPVQR